MNQVASDHGFAHTVGPHEHHVALFAQKSESEDLFETSAVDLPGPVPVEVGHGLEASDAAVTQAAFETAPATIGQLDPSDFFEQCGRAPAARCGTGDQIVGC